MNATIEGNELVVRIPLEKPRPSSSGKTLVVASSGGGKSTSAQVGGKPISVHISAWVKMD